jgi:hypothetical protein
VERIFTWDRHCRILEGALREAVGERLGEPKPVEEVAPLRGELVGVALPTPEMDRR